ncbi:MAG: hypothetical protein ACREFE_17055 [Limisphaerales bacterium]
MRPIFIIYVAAGLTLLFAVVSVATSVGSAYLDHHVIASLKPTGDDLVRMQSYQSASLDSAAQSFVLVLLQTAIIVYARKISRQNHAA